MEKINSKIIIATFWPLYFAIPAVCFYLSLIEKSNFSFLVFFAAGLVIFFAAHLLRILHSKIMKKIFPVILLYALSSVFFIFRYPLLSDDIERYIWEGYIQGQGFNPYLTAPDDPVFEKEILNKKVNHPHMPAVYPAFIQIVFRMLSYISTSIYFFKIFLFLVSLGFIVFLFRKKDFFEDSYFLAAVFPFLAVETAWSGHLDIAGIFLLTVSLYYLEVLRGFTRNLALPAGLNLKIPFSIILSSLFLGLSVMTKIIPIIFFPIFFNSIKSWKGRIIFAGGFLSTFLLYLPFIDGKGSIFYSLEKYANEWVFSGYFYTLIKTAGLDGSSARLASGIFFLFIYVLIFFKIKGIKENIFLTLLALMFLSPVVHPWYLLWLIPFSGKKFFYTSSTILLVSFGMYEVLENWFKIGRWAENPVIVIGGYSIAFAVFLFELKRFIKEKPALIRNDR